MNIYINLLLLSCMGNLVFSQGIGMEMTEDGTGLYYKQLWSLDDISHLTGDVGIHFDNSKPKIDMFGYNNNYQTRMINFIVGYRHQLFIDKLIGPFRPLFILGIGGMSDLKSFSNDNIAGVWMIKYLLGVGVQFYRGRFMNEINIKYTYSEPIASHAALQIVFYWK